MPNLRSGIRPAHSSLNPALILYYICSASVRATWRISDQMPVHFSDDFIPALLLRNEHLQTVWATVFCRDKSRFFETEKVILADGDFVTVGWIRNNHKNLAILTHGMEGSMNSSYIRGIAGRLAQKFDILAWNLRGNRTRTQQ